MSLTDNEFNQILDLCKNKGKFNHQIRLLISTTTDFRIRFVNKFNENFFDFINNNNYLCLFSELIENDCVNVGILSDKIVNNIKRLKNFYNFPSLCFSVLNK